MAPKGPSLPVTLPVEIMCLLRGKSTPPCSSGRDRSQPRARAGRSRLGWLLPDRSFPPQGGPKTVRSIRVGERLTWGSFASEPSFLCTDRQPRIPCEPVPRAPASPAAPEEGLPIPTPRSDVHSTIDPVAFPRGGLGGTAPRGPRSGWDAWGGGGAGTHHLQLVLLQDFIQVLPLLVVEVEVLTL